MRGACHFLCPAMFMARSMLCCCCCCAPHGSLTPHYLRWDHRQSASLSLLPHTRRDEFARACTSRLRFIGLSWRARARSDYDEMRAPRTNRVAPENVAAQTRRARVQWMRVSAWSGRGKCGVEALSARAETGKSHFIFCAWIFEF